MTWTEFAQWAWESHGYRIKVGRGKRDACLRPVLGATGTINGRPTPPVTGTGSGNYADYGVTHQRRFSTWLITRHLIERVYQNDWLDAAESHDTGWLVNDGSGIRWVDDPELEASDLVRKGFVAVRCGFA